jgi:hypothetical protein
MRSISSLSDEYYQRQQQDRSNRVNYIKYQLGIIDISDEQVIDSQEKENRFTSFIKKIWNKM